MFNLWGFLCSTFGGDSYWYTLLCRAPSFCKPVDAVGGGLLQAIEHTNTMMNGVTNNDKNDGRNDQNNEEEDFYGCKCSIHTQAKELLCPSALPCNQIETRRTATVAQPLKVYEPGGR